MALKRLDHVIYAVPDIEAAHDRLTRHYPEAWPVGRFWPKGRTSGIALGGLNLELVQPDSGAPATAVGTTLVFEPASFEQAVAALARAGLAVHEFVKRESDPRLLRLRGFSADVALEPQLICRNLIPNEPDSLPFDFFICDYSPFLRNWLASDHPRLKTGHRVTRLVYETPAPDKAQSLLSSLGYEDPIRIDFVRGLNHRIRAIESEAGPIALFND